MTFTNWLKSLFKKPQPIQPLRPAGELVRRIEIRDEMNGLTQQIDRLKKNKKKFSHLEPRLNALVAELLAMDIVDAMPFIQKLKP